MTTAKKLAKVSGSLKTILAILFICCGGFKPNDDKPSQIYYVDATIGSDSQNGLSPQTAWKSLDKVNAAVFFPGDEILFKTNEQWDGQFRPKGSGSKEKQILVSSYGSGKRPLIAGSGVANGAVYLYNQQCWTLKNLEITNYKASEQNGQNLKDWENENKKNYVEPTLPPQLKNSNTPKYGILILAEDAGELADIQLINLEVHGVNGYINQTDEKSKDNGGIVFKITGGSKPTFFNGVLIDSCNIHDVDRSGVILSTSSWSKRTLESNTNWTPSLNVIVRNSKFSNTGANALIVRVAKTPVMEHNLL